MLVSYNWLKYYVDLPDSLTSEELGLKLTMTTVEVEGVEKQGDMLDGVVVGEILEIKKNVVILNFFSKEAKIAFKSLTIKSIFGLGLILFNKAY